MYFFQSQDVQGKTIFEPLDLQRKEFMIKDSHGCVWDLIELRLTFTNIFYVFKLRLLLGCPCIMKL